MSEVTPALMNDPNISVLIRQAEGFTCCKVCLNLRAKMWPLGDRPEDDHDALEDWDWTSRPLYM